MVLAIRFIFFCFWMKKNVQKKQEKKWINSTCVRMNIFFHTLQWIFKGGQTKTNTRTMAHIENEHRNKSNKKSEQKMALLQIVFMQCQTKHLQNDSESISKLQSHKVVNRSKSSHFFLSLSLYRFINANAERQRMRKPFNESGERRRAPTTIVEAFYWKLYLQSVSVNDPKQMKNDYGVEFYVVITIKSKFPNGLWANVQCTSTSFVGALCTIFVSGFFFRFSGIILSMCGFMLFCCCCLFFFSFVHFALVFFFVWWLCK